MGPAKNKKIRPVHPGEILAKDFLEPLGITRYHLARETHVAPGRILGITKGMRMVTAEVALRLAQYFGTTAMFWLKLQVRYDLGVETNRLGRNLEREIRPLPCQGRMKKSNFDLYLDEQMKDQDFEKRFQRADKAWEGALQSADRLPQRDPGDLYWIGTNIFSLRTAKKLTQVELAKRAGITARALRGLEIAETDANPTLRTLGSVARALGIETVALYARRKGDLGREI